MNVLQDIHQIAADVQAQKVTLQNISAAQQTANAFLASMAADLHNLAKAFETPPEPPVTGVEVVHVSPILR